MRKKKYYKKARSEYRVVSFQFKLKDHQLIRNKCFSEREVIERLLQYMGITSLLILSMTGEERGQETLFPMKLQLGSQYSESEKKQEREVHASCSHMAKRWNALYYNRFYFHSHKATTWDFFSLSTSAFSSLSEGPGSTGHYTFLHILIQVCLITTISK
jgi:hypothetical protein